MLKELAVVAQADNTNRDLLALAADHIWSACELLRINSKRPTTRAEAASINDFTSVIRTDLEGRKLQWQDKRQAELSLAADWPQRSTLDQSLSADQKRLAALADDERENETSITRLNVQILDLNSQLERWSATQKAVEQSERELLIAQTRS